MRWFKSGYFATVSGVNMPSAMFFVAAFSWPISAQVAVTKCLKLSVRIKSFLKYRRHQYFSGSSIHIDEPFTACC